MLIFKITANFFGLNGIASNVSLSDISQYKDASTGRALIVWKQSYTLKPIPLTLNLQCTSILTLNEDNKVAHQVERWSFLDVIEGIPLIGYLYSTYWRGIMGTLASTLINFLGKRTERLQQD